MVSRLWIWLRNRYVAIRAVEVEKMVLDSVVGTDIGAQLPFFLVSNDPSLPRGCAESESSKGHGEFLKPSVLSLMGFVMTIWGLWLCILGWANSIGRWLISSALILMGYLIQANYPVLQYLL